IRPDAGQVMHAFDAVSCQHSTVADAGEQQELRRLERTGAEDHLAPRADRLRLLALPILDADRPLALKEYFRRACKRLDAQIGAAIHVRMHIGARRAPALAILLRQLVDPEPFMVLGIEILADAVLRFAGGLQEGLL